MNDPIANKFKVGDGSKISKSSSVCMPMKQNIQLSAIENNVLAFAFIYLSHNENVIDQSLAIGSEKVVFYQD
jgi:hypothetical protein